MIISDKLDKDRLDYINKKINDFTPIITQLIGCVHSDSLCKDNCVKSAKDRILSVIEQRITEITIECNSEIPFYDVEKTLINNYICFLICKQIEVIVGNDTDRILGFDKTDIDNISLN